jgi:hypothetical protein
MYPKCPAEVSEDGDVEATKFKWVAHHVPCHKTMTPLCFLVPYPKVIPTDFINYLVSPLRKIQCHGKVN